MRLLNKRRTLQKTSRASGSSKTASELQISQDIAESIELDKQILIDRLNIQWSTKCFKLIRGLRESSAFPSVMKLGNVFASDSFSAANLFNSFFYSTFSPLINFVHLTERY